VTDDSATPGTNSTAEPSAKPAYPPLAALPTQLGPESIRFDFNEGARVLLPPRETGQWRVCLRDLDTGNILFLSENKGAFVRSSKSWYVRFRIEVWAIEPDAKPDDAPRLVLAHDLDLRDRAVSIAFPVGTLGDILAWFPYAARFAAQHPSCKVTCMLSDLIIPLLADAHPNIDLLTHEDFTAQNRADAAYATYSLGLFFDDAAFDRQPTDFRFVGLHRTAGYILGVSPDEAPAQIAIQDDTRPIAEPYVCIAVQSSAGCKFWNNPQGWRDIVAFLKAAGYRVICIDQKPVHGHGLMWTHIPNGAEDETGDRPLAERARWLKHADFFVGLSSGLAWLAYAVGTKVVMISGFTHPTNEFHTPYRVINWHACNSCWNDPKVRFDHKDFLWCPRHAGTERQFECTRLITAAQVQQVIASIPGFPVV
jgi:autotransporter strand-loop-strand O-heptosyltransferase